MVEIDDFFNKLFLNTSEFTHQNTKHMRDFYRCSATILRDWRDGQADFLEESQFGDRSFPLTEFLAEVNHLSSKGYEDTYFSINTFRKQKRESDEIWHLNGFVLDYDFYKLKDFKHLTPEAMYETHIRDSLPFIPTFVVNSGRGLYVIYAFKNSPRQCLKLYRSLYEAFYKHQKQFGVDHKSMLETQVFRIPGTINSRSLETVRIIDASETDYILEDFISILPFSSQEVADYRQRKANPPPEDKQSKEKKLYKRARNRKYFSNVYEDFKTLVRIRNKQKIHEGYREFMLYTTLYLAKYFSYSDTEAMNYAKKLNAMLAVPFPEKQLEKQCMPTEIKPNVIGIKKIIANLEITEEEMGDLKVLLGDRQKKERDNRRNKNKYRNYLFGGRTQKEMELYLRRQMINSLARQGLSASEIARRTKMSKQLVGKDLAYIKTHSFEFFKKLQEVIKDIQGLFNRDNFARSLTPALFKQLTAWLKTHEVALE